MITNYQRPFQLTPSNTDHIYSFSSDLMVILILDMLLMYMLIRPQVIQQK